MSLLARQDRGDGLRHHMSLCVCFVLACQRGHTSRVDGRSQSFTVSQQQNVSRLQLPPNSAVRRSTAATSWNPVMKTGAHSLDQPPICDPVNQRISPFHLAPADLSPVTPAVLLA